LSGHGPTPFHVEVHPGGSPPLILVHGFGAHGGFWRRWMPHLTPDHEVHTIDLMGFGKSATPKGADYSPQAQGRHLAELLQGWSGPAPVLVGHSLGAGIAIEATLRLLDDGNAPLPEALVLISGAVYPQRIPPFMRLARVRGLGELFLLATPPRAALRMGLRGIVRNRDCVDDEMVQVYQAPLRSRARRRAILRAARQLSPERGLVLSARLGELDLPTLLVWGEGDRIIPVDNGRKLASDLPDARLVILPEVGHLPPEEAPEASVRPVLEFIAEGLGRTRPREAPTDSSEP